MARVNFKQLESLVAVHETHSFRLAARKLGLSQSSISNHIQELENGFFHPVFDRTGRAAKLTAEGLKILEGARELLHTRDDILTCLSERDVTVKQLRVGLTELTALTWLPRFVSRVKNAFPQVKLVIHADQGIMLFQRLTRGELDLIVLPDVFKSANVLSTRLARVQNGWFCSPNFSMPEGKIAAEDFCDYPLLLQSQQSTAGVFLGKWMKQHAVFAKDTFTCDSLAVLGGAAASGLGIASLPTAVSKPLVATGLLREIQVQPRIQSIPYSAVTRAEILSPFLKEIIEIARSTCDFEALYSSAG